MTQPEMECDPFSNLPSPRKPSLQELPHATVNEAVMLGFADSKQGDVQITPAGKEFAEADITTRKKLFREAALSNVTLIQQIRNALERKSDRTVPLEFFCDVLDKHLSQQEVQHQLDTALNWDRYAEIFTYDSQTDRLLLDEAAGHR